MPLLLILFGALLFGGLAQADVPLSVGRPLPTLQVTSPGELHLQDDESIDYAPWDSTSTVGKPTLIYHLAGTSSASDLNRRFIDRLKTLELPKGSYYFVTIVNLEDAMWGTSGLVQNSVEKRKRRYQRNIFVLDETSIVRNQWGLVPESSAVLLLDASGTLVRFKDGPLTEGEEQEFVQLINRAVAGS